MGTFGEGPDNFVMDQPDFNIPVDKSCQIENVAVLEDYSCELILQDVDYNQLSQVRVFKLQLLERNEKQKWIVWTATGKIQEG